MPIAFKCPQCDKVYSVGDGLAGKIAACACGAKLRIPATTAVPPPPIPEQDYEEAVSRPATSVSYGADDFDATSEPSYDDGAEPEAVAEPSEDDLAGYGEIEQEEALSADYDQPVADESLSEEPADFDSYEDASEPLQTFRERETDDLDLDEAESLAAAGDEADELDEDEGEAVAASGGWPGRILALLGMGLLIGSLFLPWLTVGTSPTGLAIGLELAPAAPMLYGVFGAVGLAALLGLMALAPGLLRGTVGMLLGLLFTLGAVAGTAVTLVGLPGAVEGLEAVGEIFGSAGLGLWLALAGSALTLIGGLLCAFGPFKGGAAAPKTSRPARGRAAAGRSSAARMPRPGMAASEETEELAGDESVDVPEPADEDEAVTDDEEADEDKPETPERGRAGKRPALPKKSGGLKPVLPKKVSKKASKVARKPSLRPKK